MEPPAEGAASAAPTPQHDETPIFETPLEDWSREELIAAVRRLTRENQALISREAADGREPDLPIHFWRVAEQRADDIELQLATNREALRQAADALTQAVFENQELRARLPGYEPGSRHRDQPD